MLEVPSADEGSAISAQVWLCGGNQRLSPQAH